MKIGKRILGTVMAGVLTAGLLAGCGGKPPVSSGGSQSSPADDGKLLVAAADLPVKGIFPVSDKYFNEATGDFDDAGFDKDSKAWDAAKTERERQAAEKNKGYTDFLLDLSRQMLRDPAVDNPAFSPLNIYLSLGMLAEVTDGETRAQILKTAHAGSLDDLYKSANALAQAVRRGDDAQTVDLGSSMWLSNKYPFNEDTVKKTAERYFRVPRGVRRRPARSSAPRLAEREDGRTSEGSGQRPEIRRTGSGDGPGGDDLSAHRLAG